MLAFISWGVSGCGGAGSSFPPEVHPARRARQTPCRLPPPPPPPYVGEQGQDELSYGGLDGGQPVHPHWRALGPPRFPSFPPSWASGELQRWGLPEGLGAAGLHFCAHPTTGKGGMDQRREALAGWNSPSLPVDKLSLIQAWGVVWLLQREREREHAGDREGGGKQAHKHSDTDTHCFTKGLLHAVHTHAHTRPEELHKGTARTRRLGCAAGHTGAHGPSHTC